MGRGWRVMIDGVGLSVLHPAHQLHGLQTTGTDCLCLRSQNACGWAYNLAFDFFGMQGGREQIGALARPDFRLRHIYGTLAFPSKLPIQRPTLSLMTSLVPTLMPAGGRGLPGGRPAQPHSQQHGQLPRAPLIDQVAEECSVPSGGAANVRPARPNLRAHHCSALGSPAPAAPLLRTHHPKSTTHVCAQGLPAPSQQILDIFRRAFPREPLVPVLHSVVPPGPIRQALGA